MERSPFVKKTDNFFIISNYKQNPLYLLEYCKDYLICDQSEDDEIRKLLKGKNYIETPHTGHNISDYFKFFIDNYESLPEIMVLLKGNIIGRYVSKEFFNRVYDNKYYTFLYNNIDLCEKINQGVYLLAVENQYLEINNSWYVPLHPHKYFDNFNSLLKFIYKNPLLPEYCLFSPGACYIVSKYQVLNNSKTFYKNLNKIMSYTLDPKLPSEAHQIERMLHIIFSSNYEVNKYMNDEYSFDKALLERSISEEQPVIEIKSFYQKIKNKYKRLKKKK